MLRIRVEYDKEIRAFKVLDEAFGSVLKDGVQYELVVPLVLEETDPDEDDFLFGDSSPIAHA
jgi:hypothetical protein